MLLMIPVSFTVTPPLILDPPSVTSCSLHRSRQRRSTQIDGVVALTPMRGGKLLGRLPVVLTCYPGPGDVCGLAMPFLYGVDEPAFRLALGGFEVQPLPENFFSFPIGAGSARHPFHFKPPFKTQPSNAYGLLSLELLSRMEIPLRLFAEVTNTTEESPPVECSIPKLVSRSALFSPLRIPLAEHVGDMSRLFRAPSFI